MFYNLWSICGDDPGSSNCHFQLTNFIVSSNNFFYSQWTIELHLEMTNLLLFIRIIKARKLYCKS